MSKTIRRLLIGVGVIFGTLVVLAVAIGLFFDVNHYKPQIEAAVEKSTGMNLKINGKASLKLFPSIRIALKDVHLSNRGSELFATNEIQIAPRLAPFVFHREMIVDRVSLDHPKIRIEKSQQGRMNFESSLKKTSKKAAGRSAQVKAVNIRDGELSYLDKSTGKSIQVAGIFADLSKISLSPDGGVQPSFEGKLRAKSLKAGTMTASDLMASVRDDRGLIDLNPTEAKVFGGELHGTARADLRGAVPKLKIEQKASQIDLAQIPSTGKNRVSGNADAEVNLTASGKDANSFTRTAKGNVSIRSQNITITGIDVDDLANKLKAGQGLDLVNIGSSLVAGPLAPALGQAAGIAGAVGGVVGGKDSQAKSEIKSLVSDWKVSNGVAEAKDVAFSTAKTTIAFKGSLNLVAKTYQKFYIATVDPQGCAKTKLEIVGQLNRPRPAPGSIGEQIAKSYAGQAGEAIGSEAGSLGSEITGILGGSKKDSKKEEKPEKEAPKGCDLFYSGSALRVA